MTAQVRFRHTQGDVGPFKFSTSATIGALKDKLLHEWPTDGPLAAERPSSVAEIKLICAGKFVENNVVLTSLHHVFAEPDVIVTMHVVLRPPQPQKAAAPNKQQQEQSKGCCVIS